VKDQLTMTEDTTTSTTAVAAGQLRALVERIERLNEEKAEIAEAVKEVYAEAKANGFDTKTLRKVIARRKKSRDELSEEEALLDLYESALAARRAFDGEAGE
jgi:uncharacterized protein (UPF0335 family)